MNRLGAFDGDLRQRHAIAIFDEELLMYGRFDRETIEGAIWPVNLSGFLDADGVGVERGSIVIHATGLADADAFGSAGVSLRTAESGLIDPDTFGAEHASIAIHEIGFIDPDTFGAGVLAERGAETSISDPDLYGTLLGRSRLLPIGFNDPDLFGSGLLRVTVGETGLADPDTYGTLKLAPTGKLSGLSDADLYGAGFLRLMLHGSGFIDSDLYGVLVWPHKSPRRISRLRPHVGNIARSNKLSVNGIVADNFRVIVTGEPADIQDRSGSYFQQDVGRIVQRRMVGYFDLASGIAVGDRFVMPTETFLVLHLAEKSKQIQADLERVST
jgi:hypothetical protein